MFFVVLPARPSSERRFDSYPDLEPWAWCARWWTCWGPWSAKRREVKISLRSKLSILNICKDFVTTGIFNILLCFTSVGLWFAICKDLMKISLLLILSIVKLLLLFCCYDLLQVYNDFQRGDKDFVSICTFNVVLSFLRL